MRYLLCLGRITGPAVSVSVLPAGEHSFVALFSASLCLKFAWMQGDTQTVNFFGGKWCLHFGHVLIIRNKRTVF